MSFQVLPKPLHPPGSSAACVNKCGKHRHLLLQNVLKLPHKTGSQASLQTGEGRSSVCSGMPIPLCFSVEVHRGHWPVAIKKGLGGKEDDLVGSKPGDLSLIPSAHIKVGEN